MIEKCPECGKDLTKMSREKHAFTHYRVPFRELHKLSAKAQERYKAILAK